MVVLPPCKFHLPVKDQSSAPVKDQSSTPVKGQSSTPVKDQFNRVLLSSRTCLKVFMCDMSSNCS